MAILDFEARRLIGLGSEPQPLAARHLSGPVLILPIGSMFNLPEVNPLRFLPYLEEWEEQWLTYGRVETRSIAQLHGYDSVECFPTTLPDSVRAALAAGKPPAALRSCWYQGFVPNLSHLGGDGRAAGPYDAAAYRIEKLIKFVDDRVGAALAARRLGPLPGGRSLLIIIVGFAGSSTFPGEVIPTLLALNESLRRRGLLNVAWRALYDTQPDSSSGVGEEKLRERQATTLALHASLDALHYHLRREKAYTFELGGHDFYIDQPLVNEVVYFGGNGAAANLGEQELTLLVAQHQAFYLTRGTGVGRALEEAEPRARQLAAFAGKYPTYGAAHACGQITVDFAGVAGVLARWHTLDALRLLFAPGASAGQLTDLVLGAERDVLARALATVEAIPGSPQLSPSTGLPDLPGLNSLQDHDKVTARQQANGWLQRNRHGVERALDKEVLDGIARRVAAGQLDSLGEEQTLLAAQLDELADEASASSTDQVENASTMLEQAKAALLRAKNDAERLVLQNAFEQGRNSLVEAIVAQQCLAPLVERLRQLARKYGAGPDRRLAAGIKKLGEAVAPATGSYARLAEQVNWDEIRRPLPCVVNLWQETVARGFYARYQELFEIAPDDSRLPLPGALGAILKQTGVINALLEGRNRQVIGLLERHARERFLDAFAEWTFSSFVRTFVDPDLEVALGDAIATAWQSATAWVALHDTAEGEQLWLVETPAGDPAETELYDLVRRGAPDGAVPAQVHGERGAQPSLIVMHSRHGLSLNDLAGTAPGGQYRLSLKAERAKRGPTDPIFADPRLEAMVDLYYPELKPGSGGSGMHNARPEQPQPQAVRRAGQRPQGRRRRV